VTPIDLSLAGTATRAAAAYFAATPAISTKYLGAASRASTVARAGGFAGSIQASHGVHVVEVAHVGEPDGGGEELGLARARRGEEIVDLLQDLLGLTLDVGGGIAGDLARQVDGVAMHDGGAQALARLNALDAHGILLCLEPLTLPSPQRGEGFKRTEPSPHRGRGPPFELRRSPRATR